MEMSTTSVRIRIEQFKQAMNKNADEDTVVKYYTVHALEELLEEFGSVLGRAKVDHPMYSDVLSKIDEDARSYFQSIPKEEFAGVSMMPQIQDYAQVCSLGIQKVLEATAIVERLDNPPEGTTVSKKEYEKLARENETQKQVIKILSESRGYPDILELLRLSQFCGIQIDENWVLAVCAVNLIEAAVNKKLEDLKQKADDEFAKRLRRLASVIKEREDRDIQQMLPETFYQGIRSKLDHASHKYHPTKAEAESIYKIVASFLKELFGKV